MSKHNDPIVSLPSKSPDSPITVLLSNLRLLDLDKRDDWPVLSAHIFTAKDSPQNQRSRIRCVEWICYCLYQIWDRGECQRKLLPFFPPLEPLQSISLRGALFRCLTELKKDGILGRDVSIRKSMLDDCKGEALMKMLSAFSTTVLHKVLASDVTYKNSVVGQLCLAEKLPLKDRASLLPLAIAHRSSLIALLKRKRTLRARYRDFGNALENKDQDLASKFEKIVETQDFLDKNPPSEDTVDRVCKVLDKHWQDDRRLVDVIAQGEEHKFRDALLDQGYESVWQKVSTGRFDGDISTSRYGLLEDLEKRVADQQARLEHWENFKKNLEKKQRPSPSDIPVSPTRQTLVSPKNVRYNQRNEKELVFSPRKSPRKSLWPVDSSTQPKTVKDPSESAADGDGDSQRSTVTVDVSSEVGCSSPLGAKLGKYAQPLNQEMFSNTSFGEENDNSCFSEVFAAGFDLQDKRKGSQHSKESDDDSETSNVESASRYSARHISLEVVPGNTSGKQIATIAQKKEGGGALPAKKLDEDEQLAEQHVLYASNTGPTPLERPRHLMAFVSLAPNLLSNDPRPPLPRVPSKQETPLKATSKPSLAERARQSISLVPEKSKRSRDSMHARRSSKMYPTNQFETPRRLPTLQTMTPPEELMSPGAGYDSVFKSRPKVVFSRPTSPDPESRSAGGFDVCNGQSVGQVEATLADGVVRQV